VAAATSLGVATSLNPSPKGQALIVTATVNHPSSSLTPTGTITFTVNGAKPCAVTVDSLGQASVTLSTGGGRHPDHRRQLRRRWELRGFIGLRHGDRHRGARDSDPDPTADRHPEADLHPEADRHSEADGHGTAHAHGTAHLHPAADVHAQARRDSGSVGHANRHPVAEDGTTTSPRRLR
jgi:hypothetical protein